MLFYSIETLGKITFSFIIFTVLICQAIYFSNTILVQSSSFSASRSFICVDLRCDF